MAAYHFQLNVGWVGFAISGIAGLEWLRRILRGDQNGKNHGWISHGNFAADFGPLTGVAAEGSHGEAEILLEPGHGIIALVADGAGVTTTPECTRSVSPSMMVLGGWKIRSSSASSIAVTAGKGRRGLLLMR